jgi:excisionase family DNA binding protein
MARKLTGPAILTRAEAAQVLGIHPATVTRWATTGALPSFRTPSGERRYHICDVEALLNPRGARPIVRLPPDGLASPPTLN